MKETEEQLLAQVRNGDRRAMRRLYDRYVRWATAIAGRYVGNSDDVRDVLQESFLKVFASVSGFSYRGEGSLRAWVGRLVANTALDHLRKHRQMVYIDSIPELTDEPEPDIGGVDDATLFKMISRLPDGCRTVLNLFVFEGMSHREIGERLGIRPDSSASQLFHAKRLLGKMIKEMRNERL
ncbi:MAG: RNA polymerase sigma factor [Prevotella sp.]|nr:RNA polymerase sigma factor [Prevotella sp.]